MNGDTIKYRTKTEMLEAMARRHERRAGQPVKTTARIPAVVLPGVKSGGRGDRPQAATVRSSNRG
jgi:hypothetical protein